MQKVKRIRLKGKALQQLFARVLERDEYTCQNIDCPGGFHIDIPHHIKFKSQGGEDTEENLITYCRHCHSLAHGIKVIKH